MTKIVGDLDLRKVMDGGTTFTVEHPPEHHSDDETDPDYTKLVKEQSIFNCLTIEDTMENNEAFPIIAAKMTNVLPNGHIKKRIITEGYGGKPEDSSNVKINYNAYTELESFPFDSTYARKKPMVFTMGQGEVIEGLEIAVGTMKLTEKSQFLLHPSVAFKDSGLKRIPANSTVLFEITLCEIFETTDTEAQLKDNPRDFKTIYKLCCAHCVVGKKMFLVKNYENAAKEYMQGLRKLEHAELESQEDQTKCDTILVRLHMNLLICFTHLDQPKRGCYHANKIYEMAKNHTFTVEAKVYFNNAKCLRMLGDYRLAEVRLRETQKLMPHAAAEIQQELELLKVAKQKDEARQKKMGAILVQGN